MLNRDDILKLVDLAIGSFEEDFRKAMGCMFCGVLPEPGQLTLDIEAKKPHFRCYNWITDGWAWLRSAGEERPICPECRKKKGI